MTYDAIYRGSRNKSSHGRNHSSSSGNKTCKYCGKGHHSGNCPAYSKKCQKWGRDNCFKSVCRSGNGNDKCESSWSRPRKGHKGKCFHEVNEEKNETMDDLADQVQSLFYHDIHFNAINMRMYTEIECKNPAGEVSNKHSKLIQGLMGTSCPSQCLQSYSLRLVWKPLKRQ